MSPLAGNALWVACSSRSKYFCSWKLV